MMSKSIKIFLGLLLLLNIRQIQGQSEMIMDTMYIKVENLDKILNNLGTLSIDTSIPELSKSKPTYDFTKKDALWMARFVTGESGLKNDANGHAVLWAMFNRFGILRHKVKAWASFNIFLQRYSTTLQPMMKSVGAAKRVWKNHKENPKKYPIVFLENETYKNSDILKVQYKKHADLQKMKWEEIDTNIQKMVLQILKGEISNPGIGIATEFASTRIYYKQKHGEFPNEEQWLEYTIDYAKNRCKKDIKGCTWIDYRNNINQMKNAFFIDNRFKDVPSEAIKISFN